MVHPKHPSPVYYWGQVSVTLVTEGKHEGLWRVNGPWGVTWRGRWVEVPDGFVTDGPSIPRWVRWLIPARGRQWEASVAHDYLYWHQPATWTRYLADRLLLDGLIASKVDPVRAWLMYLGARAGGWVKWNDDRKA